MQAIPTCDGTHTKTTASKAVAAIYSTQSPLGDRLSPSPSVLLASLCGVHSQSAAGAARVCSRIVLGTVAPARRSRSPFCVGMRDTRDRVHLRVYHLPRARQLSSPHARPKGCPYLLFVTGPDSVGILYLCVSRDAPPKSRRSFEDAVRHTLGTVRHVLSILRHFVFMVLSSVRRRKVCELV